MTDSLQSPLLPSSPTSIGRGENNDAIRRNSSVRMANSLVASSQASRHSLLTSTTNTQNEQQEDDVDGDGGGKANCGSKFCAFMEKYPIVFVLGGAILGVALGIGLLFWNPSDPEMKKVAIQWIGLIGDLFIRSLRMIVLPLVFVSITISVMDMLSLGEAGTIVGTTIGLYVCTTICAAIIGCICSLIYNNFYTLADGPGDAVDPEVRLSCGLSSYLTKEADGSIACMPNEATGDDTLFMLNDVNGYFAKSDKATGPQQLSLSESIYQGLFMQLVDDNMIGMFYDGNFLGVIVLGAGFGVALSRLAKVTPPGVKWDRILILQIFEELLEVFMMIVIWIIKCTPFAIISLIASAIGANNDAADAMEQLGYLLAAIITGLILQFTCVYCGMYVMFLRKNPLKYYKECIPAFTTAFAASSSAATLPVSIDCAIGSGQVPEGIARFCLPLGATINMDGTSIQIICSCIWLAYYNGIHPGAADYILLIFCATFGSMGAAPVPSASLVLILTSYQTTFGGGENPEGFAFLVAIDWLVDRLATMFNIGGDLAVSAIVANKVKKDMAEKLEGSEANTEEESVILSGI